VYSRSELKWKTVKGERETYLPGSGYNEGSSNNGSGHDGFPLLMFVPCLLACLSLVLVSSRSPFVFLLSFSVFCVCFSFAFPWFSFCSRYLLCFSFFCLCLSLLSRSVFFFFSLALTCSVFLCFFFSVLGSVLGWCFLCRDEDDGGVDLWFLSAFLPFSLGIFFCVCALFCSACFLTDFRFLLFPMPCSFVSSVSFWRNQRLPHVHPSFFLCCSLFISPLTPLHFRINGTLWAKTLPTFSAVSLESGWRRWTVECLWHFSFWSLKFWKSCD